MMTSVQTKPMPAVLNTPEVRLALVGWRSELLSLAAQYPEIYPAADLNRRIADLDAALLAIDISTTVALVPVT